MLAASSSEIDLKDKSQYEQLFKDFHRVEWETFQPQSGAAVQNNSSFTIETPQTDRDALLLSEGYIRVKFYIDNQAGNSLGFPNNTADSSITSTPDLIFSSIVVSKDGTLLAQSDNIAHMIRMHRLISASDSLRHELRGELYDMSDAAEDGNPFSYTTSDRYSIAFADGRSVVAHVPLSRFLGYAASDRFLTTGRLTFRFTRATGPNKLQAEGPLNVPDNVRLVLEECSLHVPVATMRDSYMQRIKKQLVKPVPVDYDRYSIQVSRTFNAGTSVFQLNSLQYKPRYVVFGIQPDVSFNTVHGPKSVYGRIEGYTLPDLTVIPDFDPALTSVALSVNGQTRIPSRTPQAIDLANGDYKSWYQAYQALSGRSSKNWDSSTIVTYGNFNRFALLCFDLSSLDLQKGRSHDLSLEISSAATAPYRVVAFVCENVEATLSMGSQGETNIVMM